MTPKLCPALLLLLAACGVPEGSDGTGGGAPGPGKIRHFYAVTKVDGTYGGKAVKVMAPTWTDSLDKVTCTFNSAGTNANQKPFMGEPGKDTYSKGITLGGVAMCPGATAVSTKDPGCAADPTVFNDALFQIDIELSGWDDDALVTITADQAPSGQPWCNFAAVSGSRELWVMKATTTLGKFRAGSPFPVRFVGEGTRTFDGNTSDVFWDFTMTIAPK